MEVSYHLLHNKSVVRDTKKVFGNIDSTTSSETDSLTDEVKRRLLIDTCNGIQDKTKVLSLRTKQVDHNEQFYPESMKTLYNNSFMHNAKKNVPRPIPSSPDRILDAPDFRDDYCNKYPHFLSTIYKLY